MKAFLSHSSDDKEFVLAIAKELGRQYCVYDEYSFDSGISFKRSIEEGLDESDIFVLFASKTAMVSGWVDFEIEEAWYGKLQKNIKRSLVYIIDGSVKYDDIPDWLRKGKIENSNVPKIIARDIRHHIDSLINEKQYQVFVGRSEEIALLEENLTPIAEIPPRFVFVSGLPGIGRRSLIRKKAPDILNIRKQVEVRVQDGDSINDICIRVADLVEPYSTQKGYEEIVRDIQKLTFDQARDRLIENLRKISRAGELVIFVDDGGLMDHDGYVQESIQSILRTLAPNDDAYLFFVSERKPHFDSYLRVPFVQVNQMNQDDTKRLLSRLAANKEVIMTPEQISDLSEFVAGYPPAAYFSIHQAKEYGVDLILQDKSRLTEFLTVAFLRHLEKYEMHGLEKKFIQLLTTYSPLPLPVIANILDIESKLLSNILMKLVDLALVVTTDNGFYRISDPVADAALSAFGYPSQNDHQKVATEVSNYIKNFEVDGPRSELTSILYRAAMLARDEKLINSSEHLVSDLVSVTESLYHQRQYSDSIQVGYQTVAERPNSVTGRSYLIRSLIQEERWDDAEKQIEELQKYAPLKETYFLKGFLERKKNNLREAIAAFINARNHGRGGAALYRELAFCHFILTEYDDAAKYIDEALIRHNSNRYIVDLWAQIAAKRGDEGTARKALARLEAVGDPLFYYHRLARVELVFGDIAKARAAASEAASQVIKPPFEVLATLAYCEIEIKNLDSANNTLSRLDKEYKNLRRDVRIGLRCRYEIANENYSAALNQSERISDKNTIFYKAIRKDALVGQLGTTALDDVIRISYKKELEKLEIELNTVQGDELIPTELEPLFRSS
jgi:tetratricopeptide (TPR) repeat protein